MPKGVQGFQKGNKIQWGEKHWKWKGDKVGYDGIHDWVKLRKGTPRKCEHCLSTNDKYYDWANKSGKYKRDLKDWLRLCRQCHAKFDRGRRKNSQNDKYCLHGHKRTKLNTKFRRNGRTFDCQDCKKLYKYEQNKRHNKI